MFAVRSRFALLLLCLAGSIFAPGQVTPSRLANYGNLPLNFEANQGQAPSDARFISHGDGYSLYLTDTAAIISLSQPPSGSMKTESSSNGDFAGTSVRQDVVKMELLGSRAHPHVEGAEPLPGKANYLVGNDPAKWRLNVPTYSRIRYSDVYPGVDLVYYGHGRQLEYDLVLTPGADPALIRMKFSGANNLRLNESGDLVLSLRDREISFRKPLIYQATGSGRSEVRGRFVLASNGEVRFKVAPYDHRHTLVIDPTLAYSTYFGYGPNVTGIAVDSGGEACVTGNTPYNILPATPGAYEYINGGGRTTAFVSCLNAGGTQLAYSTFLGGTGGDWATGIALDSTGNAYIAGYTYSIDFAQGTTSYVSKKPSSSSYYSGFVAKIGSRGTTLPWSTYLGGTGQDQIAALAVDSSGQVFVTGTTSSKDFPTKNAPEATYKQYYETGFVSAFSSSGTSLLYSTYLSGSNEDVPTAIAVDSASSVYVTGYTDSTDFPTTGSVVQKTKLASEAAFVTKIPVTGNSFSYSTFLSGTGYTEGYGIAVDSSGDAFVGGQTDSSDFPVSPTAFQKTNNTLNHDQRTGFVAELNSGASKLLYATYLGGETGDDQVNAVAVDSFGKAYVTGTTWSTKFPVTPDALYSSKKTAAPNVGFITILSADASSQVYSTYYGGSSQDQPNSICLDSTGAIYIAGHTSSADYPVTVGAYEYTQQPPSGSGGSTSSSFITKFGVAAPAAATPTFTPLPGSFNSAQSVTIADATSGSTIYYTTDGSTPTTSSKTYTGAISVSATTVINAMAVAPGFSNSLVATGTFAINTTPVAATPVFTPAAGPYMSAQNVTITDSTPNATVYYTLDGSQPSTSSTKYTGAIAVSSTTTINAIAVASGYTNSLVASSTYTITIPAAATPVFTPPAGNFLTAQSVTIGDTTPNSTIYYTTNGSSPSASSTKYTGAIAVSTTTTINAIAVATGYSNSAVASATYTIAPAKTAPTVSLALSSSTITTAQALTVTVTVAGTTGNTPTGTVMVTAYNYASVAAPLSNGTASIIVPAGSLSTGILTITASYSPDTAGSSSYTSSTGMATLTVTTAQTPGFTLSGTAVTVKAGATQGNTSTVTVTPTNGFTGAVLLTASVTSGPTNATNVPTVSFGSTNSVNITGTSAGTATLTITTTAAKTSVLQMPPGFGISSRVVLAGIPLAGLLFMFPRRRRSMRRLAVVCFAFGMATAIVGCGSGASSGGGSTSSPGTTAGSYTVTITATSGSTSTTSTIMITVQ